MKVFSYTLFIAFIAWTSRAQSDCMSYQDTLALDTSLELSYLVNVNDHSTGQGTLSVELVYSGLGWIGFGFTDASGRQCSISSCDWIACKSYPLKSMI